MENDERSFVFGSFVTKKQLRIQKYIKKTELFL